MKIYNPPKESLWLWQIRVFIIVIIFIAGISCVWFFRVYFSVITVVAVAFGLAVTFIYLPLYFKTYKIIVYEKAIIIKSGVLIKHERIMPDPRLIYTEKHRTILARAFGLSGLIFHATRAATFTVELKEKQSDEILGAISN